MSKIALAPNAAGTAIFTIESPGTSTNRTLTLPDDTGTIVTNSGNQAGSFTTLNTSGAVVFNDAGADVDFRVEGDTDANLLFVDAGSNEVGIGTASPAGKFHVTTGGTYENLIWKSEAANTSILRLSLDGDGPAIYQSAATSEFGLFTQFPSGFITFGTAGSERMRIDSSGNVGIGTTTAPGGNGKGVAIYQSDYPRLSFRNSSSGDGSSDGVQMYMVSNDYYQFNNESGAQVFGTAGTERARITSGGDFLVGKTSVNSATTGFEVRGVADGNSTVITNGSSTPLIINRQTDDGTLIEFRQGNTAEGTISVSGNTVSYNPFLGSHSGALADWSRSEIKVGTVMDTINELLEYKVVVIDVQEEVPAKDAVLDEEGNEIEPAQEATTQTVQKRISYNGNGAVGSTATVEYEGQEYTGVIEHERKVPSAFNKHLKVKINDTAASKTVFGVFVGWNNDSTNDGGVYNDMLVGAVGNYVIRMAAGQTPDAGDLVEADGNGCAVVQDDDIIRTKTVAKVTSTIKQVTYDDGSFLVTCVLYCG